MMDTLPDRFQAKIEPEPNSGCWLWAGHVGKNGYGRAWLNGRTDMAHRAIYELALGTVIPDSLTIDHLCRTKSCVNPRHLEVVSAAENTRRAPNYPGARTHCPSGHGYTEGNTYIRGNGERMCRECVGRRNKKRSRVEGSER